MSVQLWLTPMSLICLPRKNVVCLSVSYPSSEAVRLVVDAAGSPLWWTETDAPDPTGARVSNRVFWSRIASDVEGFFTAQIKNVLLIASPISFPLNATTASPNFMPFFPLHSRSLHNSR